MCFSFSITLQLAALSFFFYRQHELREDFVAHDLLEAINLHKVVVSSFKNIFAYCPVFTIQMP